MTPAPCASCGAEHAPAEGLCVACYARREHSGERPAGDRGGGAVALRPYSEIEAQAVEWLPGMEGRVPLGMLTVLAGEPGLGKSTLTVQLAADVSRDGGRAVLANAEDSPGVTIKQRLQAAGAVEARVADVTLKRHGGEGGLEIPGDLPALDAALAEHGARLLVIDPLGAHLPSTVNSLIDASVRAALAPLAALAEKHRAAVVLVAHLNKSPYTNALHRVGGSIGITGAARSVLLFADDPDDPDADSGARRLLAHAKCNVGPLQPTLRYEVEAALAGEHSTSRLRLTGESPLGAHDLAPRDDGASAGERDEARDFLRVELADGPRPAGELVEQAKQDGIAKRTLYRAKQELGVESAKAPVRDGQWVWRLPEIEGCQPPESPDVSPVGGNLRNLPSEQAIRTVEGGENGRRLPTSKSGNLRSPEPLGRHLRRALEAGPASAEGLARRLGLDPATGTVPATLEALEAEGHAARGDDGLWRPSGAP